MEIYNFIYLPPPLSRLLSCTLLLIDVSTALSTLIGTWSSLSRPTSLIVCHKWCVRRLCNHVIIGTALLIVGSTLYTPEHSFVSPCSHTCAAHLPAMPPCCCPPAVVPLLMNQLRISMRSCLASSLPTPCVPLPPDAGFGYCVSQQHKPASCCHDPL